MSEQHIEFDGLVSLASRGLFKVETEHDHVINARICGKMRKNKINVVQGDTVQVKVSVYDMNNGIIIKRY